ncbi:MAG: PLP-dependent cysteine synthase family protein [Gemmatimonadota bacterium]
MTLATISATRASSRLLKAVGDTPLLRLRAIDRDIAPVEIWAKAEHLNPGRSVKDRPALRMIRDAERTGDLTRDRAILDSTSGNTGIAHAWIGAALGYPVVLCIPANASGERIRTLRALGAELVLTDPQESHAGAYREAHRLAAERPDRYWFANQYHNPSNWKAHFDTTGPEIWRETGERITHFVAGIGTSGTLMGTGRFLRSRRADVELVAVQPDSPFHGLEGLKHLPTAFRPAIYDPSVPDRTVEIRTEDAQAMVRRLAVEEGLLVGTSSGANVRAAHEVARDLSEGVVVTVLADDGRMYLDQAFWQETPK